MHAERVPPASTTAGPVGGGDGTGRQVGDDEAIDVLTDFIHRGIAGTPPANQER